MQILARTTTSLLLLSSLAFGQGARQFHQQNVTASGGGGGPAVLSTTSKEDVSGSLFTDLTTSGTLNVPAKAAIAIWCAQSNSGWVCNAPTDSAGDTFSPGTAWGTSGGQTTGQWWYTCNSAGSATMSFSGHWAGNTSYGGIVVYVITGNSASSCADSNAAGYLNAFEASPDTSPTFSTAAANEVLLFGIIGNGTITCTPNTAGYTLDVNTTRQCTESKAVTSLQSSVTASIARTPTGSMRVTASVLTIK